MAEDKNRYIPARIIIAFILLGVAIGILLVEIITYFTS